MDPAAPARIASVRRRWAVLAGLWLFLVLVLVVFREVVFPFALAAVIAYLLKPILDRLERIRIRDRALPRWAGILLLYALFGLAIWGFVVAIVPQLYRELVRITHDTATYLQTLTPARVQQMAQRAERWFNDHGVPVALSSRALEGEGDGQPFSIALDLQDTLDTAIARVSSLVREDFAGILTVSRQLVTGFAAAVFGLFFVLMIAAFFSIDLHKIRGYVKSLVPPELHADAHLLVTRIDRSLAGVVRGQVTICLVNGALTFVGLLLFGVKFAFLLATLATVCSLVPIFGTFLSSVPIVLVAGAHELHSGVLMVFWILGIHALEAYFLNPKIIGRSARIHPVVIAFALVAMERVFGLAGALFASPIAAIVVAAFEFAREKAQPPAA